MSNYRFTWKSAQTWYFILVSALAVIYEVNNSNKKIVIIEIKSLKTYITTVLSNLCLVGRMVNSWICWGDKNLALGCCHAVHDSQHCFGDVQGEGHIETDQ